MAPKLTGKHITLPPFSAIRENLTAQTLSHFVPAGINTLCPLNYLPGEASTTAEFIDTEDKLFRSFNGASITSSKKYKITFNGYSGHIPFLNSLLQIPV